MVRILVLVLVLLSACQQPATMTPIVATDPVPDDPDDPAIWVDLESPEKSLILGTNKVRAPGGALHVFGLDGRMRQTVPGIDRPNNVDVEYGLKLDGASVDIAVVTERLQHRLLIYRIDGGELAPIGVVPVFEGMSEPMGIALYRRPADGEIFAIVGRKTGPRSGYLWQYRLEDDGAGSVQGVKVREFGDFSGEGEIEAIAVDDERGSVYYADELFGIRKWRSDPDHPEANRELAVFGQSGFQGDREGIAVYAGADGYIICTDQLPGNSRYLLFDRDVPHTLVRAVTGAADSTDGIDAIATPLGATFPQGLLVAMNSGARNFLLFDWRDVR